MFLLSLVLIAAKCNVNNNQMYKLMLDGQVLIAAKCNVNPFSFIQNHLENKVLIAAKCNVNIDYINGLGRAEMF